MGLAADGQRETAVMSDPIPAPLVVIDRDTVVQAFELLGRLSQWLGTEMAPTRVCAEALSLGETSDPITLSLWAEELAGQLAEKVRAADLDPDSTA